MFSAITGAPLAIVGTHIVDFAEDSRYRYMRPLGAIQIPIGVLGYLSAKLPSGIARSYLVIAPPFLLDRVSALSRALALLKEGGSPAAYISDNIVLVEAHLRGIPGDIPVNINALGGLERSLNVLYHFMYMAFGISPINTPLPRSEARAARISDNVVEVAFTLEYPRELRSAYEDRLEWFARLSEDLGIRSFEDMAVFLAIHALVLTLSFLVPGETPRAGPPLP